MIALLGRTGYIGSQFIEALQQRGLEFVAPLRAEVDYSQTAVLQSFLSRTRPGFVINAAGYTGKPNVDACEDHWTETLQGNTLFPAALALICSQLRIPYGHVSSGCIYSGAKVTENGATRVERDLTRPSLKKLLTANPGAFQGFSEIDEPNFTFRRPPCSFYSGSKALGEEAMRDLGHGYIWRLRIPFDEQDNDRNFLSKLQRYKKVYDNVNSISHRADFVNACLDLWKIQAPYGTYNVTNPGFVTSRFVVEQIQKVLKPSRSFEFWESDEAFYREAAKTPRSNCIMDCGKLLATGVKMRPVEEALAASLANWQPKK